MKKILLCLFLIGCDNSNLLIVRDGYYKHVIKCGALKKVDACVLCKKYDLGNLYSVICIDNDEIISCADGPQCNQDGTIK